MPWARHSSCHPVQCLLFTSAATDLRPSALAAVEPTFPTNPVLMPKSCSSTTLMEPCAPNRRVRMRVRARARACLVCVSAWEGEGEGVGHSYPISPPTPLRMSTHPPTHLRRVARVRHVVDGSRRGDVRGDVPAGGSQVSHVHGASALWKATEKTSEPPSWPWREGSASIKCSLGRRVSRVRSMVCRSPKLAVLIPALSLAASSSIRCMRIASCPTRPPNSMLFRRPALSTLPEGAPPTGFMLRLRPARMAAASPNAAPSASPSASEERRRPVPRPPRRPN